MDIDFKKSAVVIIDMQNGTCKPGGSLVEMIGVKELRCDKVYEPINKLRDWAYAKDIPVIYLKTEFKEDFSDAGLLAKKFPVEQFGHFAKGSWDSQIVDELAMNDKDILVTKVKWSGFYNTDLEQILKDRNINQLILCGGATDVCVQETATDAFFRNIECFVPKETTFSFFEENEQLGFQQMSFGRAIVCHLDDILSK